MKTFHITWPSGKGTEVETCDADTLDAFAMRRFGFNTYAEVEEIYGVRIEMTDPVTGARALKAAAIELNKAAKAAA